MSRDEIFYSVVEKRTLQMELSISSDEMYSNRVEERLATQHTLFQSIKKLGVG